jgi:DNA primase
MALFTRDSIDRLRDAIDMVGLVSEKTDLRRVGSRWTGLCPFHDERTPSFSVNAEEKLFYCFGCQAKGDAIGFVEQNHAQ